MNIARFFLIDCDMAFDVPMPDGANLNMLMASVRTDGFVSGTGFWAPISQIKYVVCYEAETPQQPAKVFHLVPDPDKPL